jgi:tetratricopeptide (TPR) repeat protein
MNKPTTNDDLFDLFAANEISFAEIVNIAGTGNSEEVKEQLALHLAASKAVRRFAIQQQVAGVHKMYAPEKVQEPLAPIAPLRSLPGISPVQWFMRIAASVTLLIGLYATQYVVFYSPNKMYDSTFREYYVNTERSTTALTESEISSAFRNGDYKRVVSLYNSNTAISNREKFLAGYSQLQLNNFNSAESLFQEIIQLNKQQGSSYFQDEAEYYLAMVQLKLGNTDSALKLMKVIHENKEHTFNESVSNWMILRAKWY